MLKRFVLSRCHAVAALSCVVLAPQLVAQTKSLTRLYEPVIVTAQTLPALTNDSISVFSAYRYDSYTDQFIRVPFQIDEINANGEFLKEDDPKVAIADSNDQVVFMPGDTGDRAPTDKWVEGSANKRLELEATDPQTNQKGWLYLFRNAVSIQPVEPYVRYVPGPIGNAGADTVVGTSYVEAHNSRGWFTDTAIRTSAGGDGRDILDRQKVRVRGRYLFFDIALPEDTLQFRSVEFGGGPVRLFRKLSMAINIAGIIQTDLSFIAQYLPYHTQFGADKAEIPNIAGLSVTEIRQSTDLNSRAIGMKFFNAFNRNGVTIDGVPDSPVLTITDPPDGLNWFMATGEPGTILTLVNVPLIGNARELYYKDNAAVDNADTGDKQSFGDFGLRVTGSNITGSFSFNFTTYFLGRNQAVDIGDQFKQNALNPLQVTAAEQTRSTSAVAGDQRSPVDFALAEARPNPFAPTQGATRIGFSLGSNAQSPSLRVYNLLGQEVARFESAQLVGRQEIVWDGRDQFGRLAPAGIYFYELTVGKQRAVKKLILLR